MHVQFLVDLRLELEHLDLFSDFRLLLLDDFYFFEFVVALAKVVHVLFHGLLEVAPLVNQRDLLVAQLKLHRQELSLRYVLVCIDVQLAREARLLLLVAH